MKNYFFHFILLVFISNIHAQMNFNISYNKGYFINHSENLKPVTGDDDFEYFDGFSLGLEYPLFGNKYIQVSSKKLLTKINLYQLIAYASDLVENKKVGYIAEETYPIDIRYFTSINKMTGYGFGLTITGTNHILNYDLGDSRSFKDIFNSTGLGLNGNARIGISLSKNYYLFTELVMRYVKAVRFEGKGRDFSNYEHNYFQTSIAIGLGSKR